MKFYFHKDDDDDIVFVLEDAVFFRWYYEDEEKYLTRSDCSYYEWIPSLKRDFVKCGMYSLPRWAAVCVIELLDDYIRGIKKSINSY